MKIVTEKIIFVDKCVDSEFIVIGPNRACKDCDLSTHVKCTIAYSLMLDRKKYCSYDYMSDDEIISASYLFKCATRYDDDGFVCHLRENDTVQDVISKFMEMMVN